MFFQTTITMTEDDINDEGKIRSDGYGRRAEYDFNIKKGFLKFECVTYRNLLDFDDINIVEGMKDRVSHDIRIQNITYISNYSIGAGRYKIHFNTPIELTLPKKMEHPIDFKLFSTGTYGFRKLSTLQMGEKKYTLRQRQFDSVYDAKLQTGGKSRRKRKVRLNKKTVWRR